MKDAQINQILAKLSPEDQAVIIAALVNKDNEIENLTHDLRHYKDLYLRRCRDQFCRKTEQGEQMRLFDEVEFVNEMSDVEDIVEEEEAKKNNTPKKKRGRSRLLGLSDLVKTVVEHKTLDDPSLRDINSDIVRRQIGYVPGYHYIRETHYHQYCKTDENGEQTIVRPEMPHDAFASTEVDASVPAYAIYMKFGFGNPLYRMEAMFKSIGGDISRSNLCNYVARADEALKPLTLAIKEYIRNAEINHADETTMLVVKLDEENSTVESPKGRVERTNSYVWAFMTGNGYKPAVYYRLGPSRKAEIPIGFYDGFTAEVKYIMSDGLEQYRLVPNVTVVGCLAHSRRYFSESVNKHTPKDSIKRKILVKFAALFHIDKLIHKECGTNYDLIKEKRNKVLLPKFEDLSELIHTIALSPCTGKFGEAVTYFVNQEKYFRNIFLDGRLDLSNNECEGLSIKPFVMGRKNWLFSYSRDGAIASCDMYTIVTTAKMNHLNPYVYLDYLLRVLPIEKPMQEKINYNDYLPWNKALQAKLIEHGKTLNQVAILDDVNEDDGNK